MMNIYITHKNLYKQTQDIMENNTAPTTQTVIALCTEEIIRVFLLP